MISFGRVSYLTWLIWETFDSATSKYYSWLVNEEGEERKRVAK